MPTPVATTTAQEVKVKPQSVSTTAEVKTTTDNSPSAVVQGG